MKVRIFLILIVTAFLYAADAQPCRNHGNISSREARILRHEKRALAINRSVALSDGRISPAERRILSKEKRKLKRRALYMRRN